MRRIMIALLGVGAALVVAPGQVAASAHDPVVFVHGWNGSSSTWDTAVTNFEANGYDPPELQRFNYGSGSNATLAQGLASKVDETLAANPGKATVDIVTHSMGALSSRYYLKNLGGTTKVDDWVSLGGPNHGTNTASACAWFSTQCKEMEPGSSFLNALNSGDESPGDVTYGTWWSAADGVIDPPTSTILEGATNTQTADMSHSDLHEDATVLSQVRGFID